MADKKDMALPATQLGAEVDQAELKQYEKALSDAIETVNSSLAGGETSDLVLNTAVDTIETAFSAGHDELYNLLKIGKIIETRHMTQDILAAETIEKQIGLINKNRQKLALILRMTQEHVTKEEGIGVIKPVPDIKEAKAVAPTVPDEWQTKADKLSLKIASRHQEGLNINQLKALAIDIGDILKNAPEGPDKKMLEANLIAINEEISNPKIWERKVKEAGERPKKITETRERQAKDTDEAAEKRKETTAEATARARKLEIEEREKADIGVAYLPTEKGDKTKPKLELVRKLKRDYVLEINPLMNSGKHGEALKVLDEALKTYPENIDWYREKAVCANKLGRTEVAIEALEQAMRLNPKKADVVRIQHAINLLHSKIGEPVKPKTEPAESGEAIEPEAKAEPLKEIPELEEFRNWLVTQKEEDKLTIEDLLRQHIKRQHPNISDSEFDNLVTAYIPLFPSMELTPVDLRVKHADLTEKEFEDLLKGSAKKFPSMEFPEVKAEKIPSDVPNAIRKALALYPAYNRNVFVKAWGIYKGAKSDLSAKDLGTLKTNLSVMEQIAQKDTPASRSVIKKDINNLIKNYEDALGETIEAKAEPLKEIPVDKDMRVLLNYIVDDPDIEKKVNRIFDFKRMDPVYIADETLKFELEKIKGEIDIVIYSDIFGIYQITTDSNQDKINKLKGMRLSAQRGKENVDKINNDLDSLLVFIDKFESKLKAKKEKAKDEEEKGGEKKDKKKKPEPTPTPTPTPTPDLDKKDKEKKKKKDEEKKDKEKKDEKGKEKAGKIPETIRKEIQSIMSEILMDKEVYNTTSNPKDQASLAIESLIWEEMSKKEDSEFTLLGLSGFLQKPNVTLTPEVNKYIGKKIIELKTKLIEIDDEMDTVKQKIETDRDRLKTYGTTSTEADKIKKALEKRYETLRDLKNDKNAVETAIAFKNGTMRYRSTEQVLAMVNVYLRMQLGGEKPSEKDLLSDVQKQIDKKRTKAHSSFDKFLNGTIGVFTVFSLFKPGLKATLKQLEKDEQLSKIGKEKFAQLAKFWDSRGDVEAWVNGLEGGTETVMTKIVPRIIAYIEMALREGNMTYISVRSGYKARRLLEHLKNTRHEYVLDKVEKSSQGLSDVDKMNLYFRELDKVTVSHDKLTKKLMNRRSGVRALGITGLAAAGIAGGPLVLAGLAAGGITAALGVASAKEKDPEKKAMLKKLTLRTAIASGIGVGAAVINPLLIPLALTGALSPEIWSKRKEIGKGTKWTGRAGLWGLKSFLTVGLTGGLALFTKGGRNVVFGGLKDLFTKK